MILDIMIKFDYDIFMELSIELLKTFSLVTQEMNFTRAAEKLYKTQSAVSLQMKRLSDEVGHPLFIQKGKKLMLTEKGERLRTYASRVLQAHSDACLAMTESSVEGVLSLGISDEYTPIIFTKILAGFAEKYPNVTVNVVCKNSQELKKRVDHGDLDIAILAEYESSGNLLKYEPMVWMASHDFVFDGKAVPLAVYPDYCIARNTGLKYLANAGISYRIAYETESSRLIRSAIKSGMAVSPVMSRVYREGPYRQMGQDEGFPELPHIPITLHKGGNRNDEVVDYIYEHIKKVFREL